jgi:hypothetical protein
VGDRVLAIHYCSCSRGSLSSGAVSRVLSFSLQADGDGLGLGGGGAGGFEGQVLADGLVSWSVNMEHLVAGCGQEIVAGGCRLNRLGRAERTCETHLGIASQVAGLVHYLDDEQSSLAFWLGRQIKIERLALPFGKLELGNRWQVIEQAEVVADAVPTRGQTLNGVRPVLGRQNRAEDLLVLPPERSAL